MNCTVTFDWKSFAALGLGAVSVILAIKLDSDQAMNVLTLVVGTCKEIGVNMLAG